MEKIKPAIETFFKDYDIPTDRKIFPAMFKLYNENLQEIYTSEVVKNIRKNYKTN